MDQVSKYGRWSDRVKEIGIELEVNINVRIYSIGDFFFLVFGITSLYECLRCDYTGMCDVTINKRDN